MAEVPAQPSQPYQSLSMRKYLEIKADRGGTQNYIKSQAREHPRFRRLCIAGAQKVHRLDMSLKLGLLQDRANIDKQIAREAAEAQAKRQKQEIPTVKTEAQTKADERPTTKEKDKGPDKSKTVSKPRIRPLSEAKAIDAGANFASESFLLSVGIGLIIFERWWSSRRENNRREDVSGRIEELEESEKAARRALVELEKEILRMRAQEGKDKASKRILPKDIWEPEEREEEAKKPGPFNLFAWVRRPPFLSKNDPPQDEVGSQSKQLAAQAVTSDVRTKEKPAAQNMTVWPYAPPDTSYRYI
ncbi:MAG: hypothetical protein Q9213_008402 [Squamulea squamosa]